jgi:hypothetical protein
VTDLDFSSASRFADSPHTRVTTKVIKAFMDFFESIPSRLSAALEQSKSESKK